MKKKSLKLEIEKCNLNWRPEFMGHTYSARISYFEVDLFIVFYIFIRVDSYGLFQNLKKKLYNRRLSCL